MPSNVATIGSSVLSALPAYLRDSGLDLQDLLCEARLPSNAVDDPTLSISLDGVATLFDNLARRLGQPSFGINYALTFPPASTGLLGQVVVSAPTIRDVFNSLVRILHVHISRIKIDFVEHGGVGRLEFNWPGMSAPKIQLNSFYLASLVLRLRDVAGTTWLPLSVEFEHRRPDDLEHYHRLFGTRLTFDAPRNVVVVDANTLAKRKPEIMEGLHSHLVELGERRLKEQIVATTVAERLRLLLVQQLANEAPFNLEAMADGLDILPRALQWRLGQEGTSYERILLEARRSEAVGYLRDSAHPLTRVAELLGFSELSAFTRWTQKHYHMTPSALRQHLRAGAQPGGSAVDDAT